MKLKKVLLTMLLVIVAIMTLQLNVKAANVTEYTDSEYDYFLTASNKVLAKAELSDIANAEEEIIACVRGSYTGEITADDTNKKITINNFSADEVTIIDETFKLWIEGENSIRTLGYSNDSWEIWAQGNGKITTTSYITSTFLGCGDWTYSEETGESSCTYYLGNSINSSVLGITIDLNTGDLDSSGKILDSVEQRICELIKIDGVESITLNVPNETIVPSAVFAALAEEKNKHLQIDDDEWIRFYFESSYITNTNADFKIGIEESYTPIGNMTDTNIEDARYVRFKNSDSYPGRVQVAFMWGMGGTELPDPMPMVYIYSFDESTKLYKLEGSQEDPFYTYNFSTDYPVGKYVLTFTELPTELVSNDNSENEKPGETQKPEQKPAEDKKEEAKKEEPKKEETKKDTTTATGKIPYAGGTTAIVIAMVVIAILGTVAYIKNRELKGI